MEAQDSSYKTEAQDSSYKMGIKLDKIIELLTLISSQLKEPK